MKATVMKRIAIFLVVASTVWAAPCSLTGYMAQSGLTAEAVGQDLRVNWQGEHGASLRATFGLDGDQPVIRELAVRKGGAWMILGTNLKPEFDVVSGVRRISNQQLTPLKELGLDKPEILEKEKWHAFWDAPLVVPGAARTNVGLPRTPAEIHRATATYASHGCEARTDGARLEITYPGLSLGVFSGRLVFTVYKGANLVRQEAIAKTEEPSVAYKYNAGLKGFHAGSARRVVWRDVARAWQKYELGGAVNQDPVALRARNRLALVEFDKGSLAVFPPSHKFFFAREIELNLGYVWYRKDSADSFSIGVRQAEREEMYRPYGVSDDVYKRRAAQSRGFAEGNFALYNAPPGTWQRMAVYYYLSPENSETAQKQVLAYTHDDTFKPLPGYKVAISHFHTHFNEMLTDAGTMDLMPNWIPTFRGLGVNIAMMSDFHGDGHANDPGPLRYKDQNVYFEGCRRFSDKDFLIMPGEEPDAYFGGHYTVVFPHPVYWTKVRKDGKLFIEQDPKYGRVYHIADAKDELDMLQREGGLMWQAHPRTKGSSGYPDAVKTSPHYNSDNFLGASYQSLPVDLSEQRICEERCFGTLDDMNNWGKAKYMIAEGDTYQKFPEDETFSHLIVNYVKLDRVPRFDEDWSPVLKAMRRGDYFVSSGEVLIPSATIEGAGAKRTMVASVEWTFPLEFLELVWGDGKTTSRQVIPAKDYTAFGSHTFRIPFDTSGKTWVRFAVWDSAGNGAFTQPVHFTGN
jgi:hypothetical protein